MKRVLPAKPASLDGEIQEVLATIVTARFGDSLPDGAITTRLSKAHNPVRLVASAERLVTRADLECLNAWVTPEEVVKAAHEVIALYGRGTAIPLPGRR